MQRLYLKGNIKNVYIVSNLARHLPEAAKANEIQVIAKMFMLYS